MAYVIYLFETESYDVCGYFDLDELDMTEYEIIYQGCFEDCINFLERL